MNTLISIVFQDRIRIINIIYYSYYKDYCGCCYDDDF